MANGSPGDQKKRAIGGQRWGEPRCAECQAPTRRLHHQWRICQKGHRAVVGPPAESRVMRWWVLLVLMGWVLLCALPLYTLHEMCGTLEELYCGPVLIWGPSPSEWWWAL